MSTGGGEVELFPVPPEHARSLRVVIDPTPVRMDPGSARRTEEVWERKCRENPRLFGGGVLSVTALDLDRGVIRARIDDYKRLVVQPEVDTGVWQLSASAVLLAPDERQQPCVLLGKRGADTRMYPGLWQLCPAGGVEPPRAGEGALTHADLAREVSREMREEAGIEPPVEAPPAACVVRDLEARSYDVIMRVGLERALEPSPQGHARWEHQDLRWVPLDEIDAFDREHRVIASTRAVLSHLRAAR